jgi:CheY-like chemotaxis protein
VEEPVDSAVRQSDSHKILQADEALWNRAVFVIAEDEVVSRTLLRRQLEKAGYRVYEAPNGVEALNLVEQHKPDLLLSDWMMPELDGIELCRRVKENPETANTYILILTSREDKDDLVRALDAGADDYLRKPWDVSELLARIRAGLRVVKLQRSLALRNEDLGLMTYRLKQKCPRFEHSEGVVPQEIPHTPALDVTGGTCRRASAGALLRRVATARLQGFLVADVSGHGAPAMVTMRSSASTCNCGGTYEVRARCSRQSTGYCSIICRGICLRRCSTDHPQSTLLCHYASGKQSPVWFLKRNRETVRLQDVGDFR